MNRFVAALALWAVALPSALAQELKLPNKKDSFHFAVIGDSGTGGSAQYKIAQQMETFRGVFQYDVVIMMGDNLYGGESPGDFQKKFERPYDALLKNGVKFYATLGNHDNPNQRFYKNFNMGGRRFYSFKPNENVKFFVLDSNYMSKEQLDWIEKEMNGPAAGWKIAYFHHPLYSSGDTHGSSVELRKVLEPIFVKHGMSLVLAGHEHFYERIKPQKGIPYFIVGSSAKLRKGNILRTGLTAKGEDKQNAFMLCEIDKDTFYFQVISSGGTIIDSGTIQRPEPAK
ncbi:MAG: metallophosphoesterase [Acidobacteria bacterium]|nr:metallophosphoesterase [Acidobacteriota bacterium]